MTTMFDILMGAWFAIGTFGFILALIWMARQEFDDNPMP